MNDNKSHIIPQLGINIPIDFDVVKVPKVEMFRQCMNPNELNKFMVENNITADRIISISTMPHVHYNKEIPAYNQAAGIILYNGYFDWILVYTD